MDNRRGCVYFKFWTPSLNDFNRGEMFEVVGTCHANYELLLTMQKDLTYLKLLMQKTHKTKGKCSGMKTIVFLNTLFFICAIVVLITCVVLTAK